MGCATSACSACVRVYVHVRACRSRGLGVSRDTLMLYGFNILAQFPLAMLSLCARTMLLTTSS